MTPMAATTNRLLRPEIRAFSPLPGHWPGGGAQSQPRLPLGIGPLDAALSGGLELAAVHECAAASALHVGAATIFVSGLARLA